MVNTKVPALARAMVILKRDPIQRGMMVRNHAEVLKMERNALTANETMLKENHTLNAKTVKNDPIQGETILTDQKEISGIRKKVNIHRTENRPNAA